MGYRNNNEENIDVYIDTLIEENENFLLELSRV